MFQAALDPTDRPNGMRPYRSNFSAKRSRLRRPDVTESSPQAEQDDQRKCCTYAGVSGNRQSVQRSSFTLRHEPLALGHEILLVA
jgi:hypothetical protein